jgi:multiple sugar transport system ATP-binding protein
MNFVEARINGRSGSTLTLGANGLPPISLPVSGDDFEIGQQVTIGIRPEHLEFSDEAHGWPASVNVAEQHGASSFLHCSLANGTPLLVHQPGQSRLGSGDAVRVLPCAGQWHLFDAEGLRMNL